LQIGDLAFFWPQGNKTSPLTWIYQEVFAPARWNAHTFEYGEVAIQIGDWVIDAGACEGFFTYYALKRGANVLVIEPVPVLVEALSRTFEAEIKAGRVQILWGALGDKPGEFGLRIAQDELYLSGLEADGDIIVPVYTLDGLLEQEVVPSIDFVKMDIEGHEVAAVQGGINLLRTSSPQLSIAVYHQEENARIIRQYLQEINPMYNVHWRGIWARSQDLPRPYMLYASQKRRDQS
jgi:FkbM family methyltransferase